MIVTKQNTGSPALPTVSAPAGTVTPSVSTAGSPAPPGAPLDLSAYSDGPPSSVTPTVPQLLDWSNVATTARSREYWRDWSGAPQEGAEQKLTGAAAKVRSGRVWMDNGLKMNLSTLKVSHLSELSRQQMLAFLSQEMSRLVGPVRINSDWSKVTKGTVTLNPADPRRTGEGAAAEACFLPLQPSQRYSQLELVGSSRSAAVEGKQIRDFVTGEDRPIQSADGAYGAVFLVRDDGVLIPVHQGNPSWGENVKFFEMNEHETLFGLDIQPEQTHGVIGLVLMNVSAPSRKDSEGAKRTSAIELRELRAWKSHAALNDRIVYFGDRAEIDNQFPQLQTTLSHHVEKHPANEPFHFTAKCPTTLFVHYLGEPGYTGPRRAPEGSLSIRRGNRQEEVPLPAWQGIHGVTVAPGEEVSISGESIRAIAVNEAYDAEAIAAERHGLPDDLSRIFNQLSKSAFGSARPDQIRASIEAELIGELSTAHMSELFRICRPLGALVHSLLHGAFAQENDCQTPGDVMYRLFYTTIGDTAQVSQLLLGPGVALPADFDAQRFTSAVAGNDTGQVLQALGRPADADLAALCTDPPFLQLLFLALAKSGLSPVGTFVQIFSGSKSDSLVAAATAEFQTLHAKILKAEGFPLEIKTPSSLLRTMFPRTREDLERAGVPFRLDKSGHPLGLVSRATAPENVLLHLPHGRSFMGEFTPRKDDVRRGRWLTSLERNDNYWEVGMRANSPFTSWSAGAGATGFQITGSSLSFAEVPPEEMILNVFGRKGESEVLLTANNPANIRMSLECTASTVTSSTGPDSQVILEGLMAASPLTTEEARALAPHHKLTYLRDNVFVDSSAHQVKGVGADYLVRLLDEEISKNSLDRPLSRLGLRRAGNSPVEETSGRPLTHPVLGAMAKQGLGNNTGAIGYGAPFRLDRKSFNDSQGRMWNLPYATTRKSGLVWLEDDVAAQATMLAPGLSSEALAAQGVGARVHAFVSQRVAQDLMLEATSVRMTENGGAQIGPVLPSSRPAGDRAAMAFVVDALFGVPTNPEALAQLGLSSVRAGAGFVSPSGGLSAEGWSGEVNLEQFRTSLSAAVPYFGELTSLTREKLLWALAEVQEAGLVPSFGAALEFALRQQTSLTPGGAESLRYALVSRLQERLHSLEAQLSRDVFKESGLTRIGDPAVEGSIEGRYRDLQGVEYRLNEVTAERMFFDLASSALWRRQGFRVPALKVVQLEGKTGLATEVLAGDPEGASDPKKVGSALAALAKSPTLRAQLIDGLLLDLVTARPDSGTHFATMHQVPAFSFNASPGGELIGPQFFEALREATDGQHPIFTAPLEEIRERADFFLEQVPLQGAIAEASNALPQPPQVADYSIVTAKRVAQLKGFPWSTLRANPAIDWL